MRVEILCTGNELLDGSVVDSNSAWLEGQLFALGEEVAEKRVVPDDLAVIESAMREIASRADFCVVSGGLGPTQDDLTAEALARVAGVPLVEHAEALAQLKARLAERGKEFTPSQARQVMVPRGCEVLLNQFGTAPHMQMQVGRCRFALLPGVPREFTALSEAYVLPRIREFASKQPRSEHYAFAQLRCVGIWEADMAWAVRELPSRYPSLRLGTRTAAPENHLKLRVSAESPDAAKALLAKVVADAKTNLGDKVFTDRDETLPETVLRRCLETKSTVSFAESCTGGMVAALFTDPAGASASLKSSLVTYTIEAKCQLLGLDPAFIEREGVVSEAVARAMAEAVRSRAGTNFGGGVTGWAGPTGSDPKNPTGTVYIALASEKQTVAERLFFPGVERARIRRFAAYGLLNLLRLALR
jgi:nicotinamide-nucleotide amidase